MTSKDSLSEDAAELRRQAEEIAREEAALSPGNTEALSPEETRQTLHELQVHQIELEMQNEELRRIQEELVESRDRYSDLYDFAPVGYLTVSEKGLILAANLTAAKMLGVERASLVQRPLSAVVVAEDQDTYYMHRRDLLASHVKKSCELRMRNESGEPFWASMESVVVEDCPGGDICIRSVIADVTDRKRTEKEIEDLAKFPSENPHPVMRVGADFTVLYTNAASRPLLDSLGSGAGKALPADWRKASVGTFGSDSEWQVEVTHKGRIFSFNVVPVRGAVYSNWYGRDVTERSHAEEAFREANRRLRTTLESITDAFVSFDRQWRYVYVNDQACRVLRKSREKLLDSVIWETFPEARESPFYDAFIRASEEGVVVHLEAFYAPLNTWFSCRCFPSPEGLSVYFQDVTDRKRAEAELKSLNEELESRVTERTAVAERRAEDLRRLTAELSLAEHQERKRLAKLLHDELQQLLLAAKLRLASITRNRQEPLRTELKTVADLLDECMGTSRDLTVELSPLILSRGTLHEILEWLGRWSGEKHGLAVAVDAQEPLPPVPEHVRLFLFQAVRELLFNAVKHSGAMEARVALSFGGGFLTVQVEDAGKHFDARAVQQKLDLASGFGLFSTRERVDALRGRMEVGTTPSGGACFRLIVPVESLEAAPSKEIQPAHDGARPPIAEEPQSERGIIRLLVVDDHKIVREGLILVLAPEQDLEVVGEAADGQEAIRQTDALRPDVIIMDVEMPTMDGIEATRQIKQRWPDVRVIGLSLHEEEAVVRAMTEAGAAAYLSKQAPAEDLIEAIRCCCGRK